MAAEIQRQFGGLPAESLSCCNPAVVEGRFYAPKMRTCAEILDLRGGTPKCIDTQLGIVS
jgi:hypothetical protein